MTTVTIPKELKEQELIAVPRSIYKDFLAWQKQKKSKITFEPTKKEQEKLKKARKNFGLKKFISLNELRNKLEAGNR